MNNLYNLYVKAWRNYEDEQFMTILTTYFRKMVDRYELNCLNDFWNDYYIQRTDEDTYQILKYGESEDKPIWEGEDLTGDVVKRIAEGE